MGVASLVLGIVSFLIGLIPFCGIIAFIPALVGLILGIVEIVKKSKAKEKKGMGIAGTILSAIAMLFIIVYTFLMSVIFAAASEYSTEYDYYDSYNYDSYDYDYDYDWDWD